MILNKLMKKIDKLSKNLERSNLEEIAYVLGNKKQIIIRNLLAGISRGVGITIGITVITAIIIYILQKIIALNLPLIGDYIVDIINIVENKRY